MVSPYFDAGDQTLRAEKIDTVIQGLMLDKYVVKPLFTSIGVAADTVKYYRETDEDISAKVEVIARGAGFPEKRVSWDDLTAVLEKRGLQDFIAWEDLTSNNFSVQQRTLIRVADSIAKNVDGAAVTALAAGVGLTVAATIKGPDWSSPTLGRPQDSISRAKRLMRVKNYEPDTLLMHPTDAEFLEANDDVINAFSRSGSNVMKEGFQGRILDLNAVISNKLTAGTVYVIQSGKVGTYATLENLKTFTKTEPGIGAWIRAWENGVFYVTNPNAICSITATGA